MSYSITFNPLTVADIFLVKEVKVYNYEGDTIITEHRNGRDYLLHLYENEVDAMTMYGLNRGDEIKMETAAIFIGVPIKVEVSFAKSELNWDFNALVLRGNGGVMTRIYRNNASLPEPGFARESLSA